jgi:plasmid stabilization system protein ParE
MAFRIVVTPSAQFDLEEYSDFVAADSPRHAQVWLAGAWSEIFSLAENAEKFAVMPESIILGTDIRAVHYRSHRIVYRIVASESVVQVLRVYHSARKPFGPMDLPDL